MNTKSKGDIGESAFLYAMVKEHVTVAKVFGDNDRYDFIIEINNICYKVQVKTGSFNIANNNFTCMLYTNSYNYKTLKYTKKKYSKNDVDLFALYCIEKDILYLIPFDFVNNIMEITISLNKKIDCKQIVNRWFFEDINYINIINTLKNNKEIENPLILNESLSTYKNKNKDVPQYILDKNDSKLISAYKKAIKSASGFRGVTINPNKNGVKWKSHFRQDNYWVYIGSSNDAKELALLHDQKGIELLGDKAITNKKLGLL